MDLCVCEREMFVLLLRNIFSYYFLHENLLEIKIIIKLHTWKAFTTTLIGYWYLIQTAGETHKLAKLSIPRHLYSTSLM